MRRMDRLTHRGALSRALNTAAAVLVAIGGGTVVAGAFPEEAPPPPPPAEAVVPDYQAVADTTAAVVSGLRATLPAPEDAPRNPRAATPEIVHGQLEIPSIGLSQPLFEGVTLTAIDRGPSHWPGTAMPGQLGNVVVAGHRTTKTRPFWDLDLVQPGAALIFSMANGDRFTYTLDRTEVVDDSAIHIVDPSFGYRATLFGCHPKGSAAKRIVGHFTLQKAEYADPATAATAPALPSAAAP
jgi:sortase A